MNLCIYFMAAPRTTQVVPSHWRGWCPSPEDLERRATPSLCCRRAVHSIGDYRRGFQNSWDVESTTLTSARRCTWFSIQYRYVTCPSWSGDPNLARLLLWLGRLVPDTNNFIQWTGDTQLSSLQYRRGSPRLGWCAPRCVHRGHHSGLSSSASASLYCTRPE